MTTKLRKLKKWGRSKDGVVAELKRWRSQFKSMDEIMELGLQAEARRDAEIAREQAKTLPRSRKTLRKTS
ncbi:MAG: hypothetical protein IT462_09455 [Planctomycetes bacterium]|nr:hypothetical protein [Planctomycetota bacterium]